MYDLDFRPIHKNFGITISSIKYAKNTKTYPKSRHVFKIFAIQNYSFCRTFRILGKNATLHPTQEKANRVKKILKLLDICQSRIVNEELSIDHIINASKRNKDYFTKKNLLFKRAFENSKYTSEQR